MAVKYLTPFAPAVAQIATGAIASVDGTPANNTFTVTIGGIAVSVAGVTNANATAAALVAALNASTSPYFAAITWTNPTGANIVGTADAGGNPFIAVLSKTGGGTGTVTAFAATVASSGPNDWSTAANYSDGAIPATGDTLILRAFSVNMVHGASALSGVTLAELRIDPSYTGNIGLDYTRFVTSADGNTSVTTAKEYRAVYLQISATLANINSGGQRLNIDLGSVQSTVNINGTAGSAPAAENNRGATPLRILCNHASTVINVNAGTVGICYEVPAETSMLATLNIADQSGAAKVFTGKGITVATVIAQSGTHVIESNQTITTATANGGTVTFTGTGAITTLNVTFGTCYANTSGTIGTLNAVSGTLNMQGDARARTVSTLNWNGAILMIDFAVVTVTAWVIQAGMSDKVVTLKMA